MRSKAAATKSKQVMDRWILPGFGVTRLAAWGTVLALGAYVAMVTPLAPWSAINADRAYAEGRMEDAVALYEALVAVNPDPQIRKRAMERSAKIAATRLGDPEQARYRWKRRLAMGATTAERAQIWETIADLHWAERQNSLGDKQEQTKRADWAVEALVRSFRIDQTSKEAAPRLLRAAMLLQESGQRRKTIAQLKRLARIYPAYQSRVDLELAQIKLSVGNEEQALGLFESAEADPELAMVARMGAATCLERLGSLDEALAELDELDEMEGMMGSRIERIRNRR